MSDGPGVLRIGEVARRTGVAVPTLRAWERRYELLDPDRSDGGHRLYRDADVARVRRMRQLMDSGWSAGAAAREVLRGPAAGSAPDSGRPDPGPTGALGVDELVARLEAAIDAFDVAATDAALDDAFARLDVPRAVDDVLLPVLRSMGEGWQDDPQRIAREHFATHALRPRMQRLLRVAVPAGARSCLAAAPELEEHDLGLLASAVVAAHSGWRVHYLGARTPTRALERGLRELQPEVVLIGAIHRPHAEAFLADEPRLDGVAVVLGGPGFLDADLPVLGRAVRHEGPLAGLGATLERATGLSARSGT